MRLTSNNMRERAKNTLMDLLKIAMIETDEDTVEATMPVTQNHTQTMGVLHGGATISLAETVAGVGSNLLCSSDERCFGMQISANHISSAQVGDTVHATASIVHKGRTTHVWDVNVVSQTTGRLISTVRVTNAVVKKVIYIKKN